MYACIRFLTGLLKVLQLRWVHWRVGTVGMHGHLLLRDVLRRLLNGMWSWVAVVDHWITRLCLWLGRI